MLNLKELYNIKYQEKNHFGYKEWIYAPYISSLVSIANLKAGSSILDVGCGQGFFSYLFYKCGLRVTGIDISETGIQWARSLYSSPGIDFMVVDILSSGFKDVFDVVFVRSCSLYNTDDFPMKHEVTNVLLNYVKEGGTFIFCTTQT